MRTDQRLGFNVVCNIYTYNMYMDVHVAIGKPFQAKLDLNERKFKACSIGIIILQLNPNNCHLSQDICQF